MAVVIGVAVGVVVAQGQGARVVGAVLLLGPSVVFAVITRGVGVGWSVELDEQARVLVGRFAGESVPDLASFDVPVWPMSVVAVVLLLVCGVLTGWWTAGDGPVEVVVRSAAGLGVVFGGASLLMVVLASVRLDLVVSVRGFVFLDTSAGVGGVWWEALLLGLLAGAVAGALGGLVVVAGGRVAGGVGNGVVAGGRG
ncbi:hypothetical protein [Umezawaea sp. Da 62-37]|uniref:hypothetical protein n=1 Tax=Umezawaea sp. Da 62-37 TaxID=3075927 RepID=UPI0028F70F1A|nr:hypothetical protein [Umezawaea sp. Da 62-37]WNV89423.1 hypothetical protein RM788_14290 [Umezawaea sp. Da 62-37]